MPEVHHLGLFLSASFLVWITPGPDTFYILARTLSQGRVAGLISTLGIGSGILVHTLLAVVGLSALMATSALAFTLVKYLGAAYLVWLGIQALLSRSNHPALQADARLAAQTRRKLFWQGFLTNLLNPKVAIFFLAFLPQFVNTGAQQPVSAFLLLGLLFAIGGSAWCLLLVATADRLFQPGRSRPALTRWLNKAVGLVYIGMGLNLLRARL